jgi:hypothetical protein
MVWVINMKRLLLLAAMLLLPALPALGTMTMLSSNALFQGIGRAIWTNTPDATIPRVQSVNVLYIDLQDPGVQLFVTPRAPNFGFETNETRSLIVSNFIRNYGVKVATACNFYSGVGLAQPADPPAEGLPCMIHGMLVCTGQVVSLPDSTGRRASFLFDFDKTAIVNYNNQEAANAAGMHTVVTGSYPVLSNGVVMSEAWLNAVYPDDDIHRDDQPRTVFGLSQDRRYLYLLTIDGRQIGYYSDGATDQDSGLWMLQVGAWDAINMDGGGSASMYQADCAGNPVALNHSSFVAAYPLMRRERIIGNQFGVYADELPSFISNVRSTAGGTTALIRWATQYDADSYVEYGTTPDYGSASTVDSEPVTEHVMLLTGLTPGMRYYYRVFSDGEPSACGAPFTTTNLPNATIFSLTNTWQYSVQKLDGANWTSPNYDDQFWSSGPGVLWCDTHYANGYSTIQFLPLSTRMPTNVITKQTYPTYYFRTHFNFPHSTEGVVLYFSNYVDDGAAWYLNGKRLTNLNLRIPSYYDDYATNYLCSSGDASCAFLFHLSGDQVTTNLVQGDNVLAVEAHNIQAASYDVTFGCALTFQNATPPDFIYSLAAIPGRSNATIAWATLSNATTQVRYGLASNSYTFTTALDSTMASVHTVFLSDLSPGTAYYFQAASSAGGSNHVASGSFTTLETPVFHPQLRVALDTENNILAVSWDSSGWILQYTDHLDDPDSWADVADISPYYMEEPSGSGFFRLRN